MSAGSYSFTPRFKWSVISDTGTSFIGGPQKQVMAIADEMGASYDKKNEVRRDLQLFSQMCSVFFYFFGNKFFLRSSKFRAMPPYRTLCSPLEANSIRSSNRI